MKEKINSKPKTCLDAINMHLENLGSSTRWKKAPNDLPEYQSLHQKKIVLVDDQPAVIEDFTPYLTVATQNNFSFLLCEKSELVSELADRIKKENADIVLLDYNISSDFNGGEVARTLVKINHKGLVVGFSSDKDTEKHWIIAKVYAVVTKQVGEPEESVKNIALISSELDEADYTKREYAIKQSGYISSSELEVIGDHDSGAGTYQHAPEFIDQKWLERIDSLVPRAECLNTLFVYTLPTETIDIQRTLEARMNYIKKQELPVTSSYYPKGFCIIYDENGLPIFCKIE